MTASPHALTLAKAAAEAALDKIAKDVVAVDVSDHLPLTDIFVVASAANERQIGAIVDEVDERLREQGARTIRREGDRNARWVLLDFGDIVVHVQHVEERGYYQLDRLWKDCPSIDLEAVPSPARPAVR